jgi:hypothetical protein
MKSVYGNMDPGLGKRRAPRQPNFLETMKMARTRAELLTKLDEQIGFLARSCELYDGGTKAEAFRLAVTACNLVHDTRRMRSILSQLGIKENIQYVSSGRASPGPKTHSILSLTVLAIAKHKDGSRSAESVSMLDQCIAHRAMRAVDFDTWWVKEMVWQSPEKIILNRCGLVTSMRDQDGGAHLDSELKHPGYISSSKENQWWWLDSKGQPLAPMFTYDHFAIMRQIAWELQKTLQDNADKLML